MCKCDTIIFFMPSNRKRIGFLPSEEVHSIIDSLCKIEKYSQSKVTGILVEEALKSRGLLKKDLFNSMSNININKENTLKNKSSAENINLNDDLHNSNLIPEKYKEDYKMINEFIEFKFFKKIMNHNNYIHE